MDYTEKTIIERFFSQLPAGLAKVSFMIYFFFVFFGTSIPFQKDIIDIRDIATSNPINQYGYSLLYILSGIGMLAKRDMIFMIVKKEKFFSLFILWSFLSVFWSDNTFVSFKRWVQFFGTGIIILSALLHFESADEALGYLKMILIVYIPLSFLSILLVPGAIQSDFAWRGIAIQKNMLGQISLMSLIIWSMAAVNQASRKTILALIFWGCLSLMLLIGSKSISCILTGILLVLIIAVFNAKKAIFQPLIGRFFSLMFFLLFALCVLTVIYFNPDILAYIFDMFGKDMTLTGRLELWDSIFKQTQNYLFYGCGFGGFWVVDSPAINILYDEYTWFPNESHLGYLDILNETGVVGLLLFTLMVIHYFSNLSKLDKPHLWKWILIAILLLNITESTFIITNTVTGVLFIFSYLALQAELLKNSKDYQHKS